MLVRVKLGEALEESVFGAGGLEVTAHSLWVASYENMITHAPLPGQVVLGLLPVEGDALGFEAGDAVEAPAEQRHLSAKVPYWLEALQHALTVSLPVLLFLDAGDD